jgi:hypothetical protein
MQCEVGEQGVDGRQAVVAAAGAVVPVLFQVVQERGDQRRVEVGDVEGAGRLAGLPGGEGQREPWGKPGGDGVGAGRPLADQPVGEIGLQGLGVRAVTGASPVRRPLGGGQLW